MSTFPQNTQKFEAIILRGKHLVFDKFYKENTEISKFNVEKRRKRVGGGGWGGTINRLTGTNSSSVAISIIRYIKVY